MMLQYLDYFSQFVITCTGMGSLYFMASQSPTDRLKGGLIGLFGEPFQQCWWSDTDLLGCVALLPCIILNSCHTDCEQAS